MSGEPVAEDRRHPIARLESVVLVAIGGFAGANLRYLADLLLAGFFDGVVGQFGGTLVANVTGSLALGFLLYGTVYSGSMQGQTRAVVATGFLSSYTTYSTFVLESATASPVLFLGNVLANYALGFGAVLLGRALAVGVAGPGTRAAGGGED
jgi:CrcB protein